MSFEAAFWWSFFVSVLGCGVAVGLVVSFGGGMRAGSTGNGGPDVFLFGVGLRR